MPDVHTLNGTMKALVCEQNGPPLGTEQDAVDLIGETWGNQAEIVVVPVERLSNEFFSLDTKLAGLFTQKFVNYQLKLAIVGDISHYLEQSSALRAFVHESNRGKQIWFFPTIEALEAHLRSGSET